jgi:hypothetical protein
VTASLQGATNTFSFQTPKNNMKTDNLSNMEAVWTIGARSIILIVLSPKNNTDLLIDRLTD